MDESLGAPEAQDIDHLAPKEQVEYYLKALMVGPEQASTSGSRESDLIIRDRTGREVGTARVDLDGTADGSAESFVSLLDKHGNPYELFYYFWGNGQILHNPLDNRKQLQGAAAERGLADSLKKLYDAYEGWVQSPPPEYLAEG